MHLKTATGGDPRPARAGLGVLGYVGERGVWVVPIARVSWGQVPGVRCGVSEVWRAGLTL